MDSSLLASRAPSQYVVPLLRRPPIWLLALLGWTALALATAGQHFLTSQVKHDGWPAELHALTFGELVWSSLVNWYAWAALSPLILRVARRLSIGRLGWARAVAVHLVLGVVATGLQVSGHLLVDFVTERVVLGLPLDVLAHGRSVFLVCLPWGVPIYLTMVGLVHAFDYYRDSRLRMLTASKLETQLAQAQLQLLQVQMQPHFLFNTLHAISSLMHQDVDAADRMLARLSELLRFALESVGTQEVSLRRELKYLAPYLDIERRRFGENLTVVLDVAPETLDARVPSLLLQPLVENAIRHGVARRVAPGRVEVQVHRSGDALEVCVRDDGPGLSGGDTPLQLGVGLQNTRERLEGLYGEGHALAFGNRPGGGFEVAVSFPFRTGWAGA